MGPLRVGVLGLGRMGLHHVRCVRLASGLALAGASDLDPARARSLPSGVAFTTDPDELVAGADAIVLAVPTDRHREIGGRILAAGRHLLVEKPLAPDVESCRALEDAAGRNGRVLRVGHVERWNGAITALAGRLQRPQFVEGHRLAAFDPRGTEVDVILDLMIHDLDLVLDMYGEDPERVEAVGVPVLTAQVDIANARLEFSGGELVNLTASRVSREPVRKLRLFARDAYVSADLAAQSAELWQRSPEAPGGIRSEVLEAPEGHNPLVCELESFARACRGEDSRLPDAGQATRAVALAERVLRSIEKRQARWARQPDGEGAPWAPGAS